MQLKHSKLIDRSRRRKWLSGLLVTCLVACASPLPKESPTLSQGDYRPLQDYVPELTSRVMKEKGITGLSIAVIDDQDIIYSNGFGYADRSSKTPANPETLFPIGSVSKLFTATTIMQLAEKGIIDIDKPIQTYLDEFSIKSRFENAPPITVRHLLTHHSGLPSDRFKGFYVGNYLNSKKTNSVESKHETYRDVTRLLQDEYLATAPDTIFSYSNLGFSLLGEIISRVSNMPFEEAIEHELLKPLNMHHSTFDPQQVDRSKLSRGYLNDKEVGFPIIRDIPTGQMVSSAKEMSHFLQMIFAEGRYNENSIIRQKTLNEMFRIQNSHVSNDGDFQIGLTFWALPPSTLLEEGRWHGGDFPPYYSLLIALPNTKLGIVVMANSGQDGSLDLTQIALPLLRLAYEIKTGNKLKHASEPEKINMQASELKKYEGIYALPSGLAKVRVKNNNLEVSLRDKTLQATALSDGSFSLNYNLLGIIPLQFDELKNIKLKFPIVNGQARLSMNYYGITNMGTAAAVQPAQISEKWISRTGIYEITNHDEFLEFESIVFEYNKDSGFYFMHIEMNEALGHSASVRLPLKLISDNEAILLGEGRGLGETILVTRENGKDVIQYSGLRLKKKQK